MIRGGVTGISGSLCCGIPGVLGSRTRRGLRASEIVLRLGNAVRRHLTCVLVP